ncbi:MULTISPECIES: SDR family NAD(P)-dependent oxidoreductase [Bacillus]|uniref:Oxidoreductase n=1 Tax=Bacillus pseudomycoides TaxID=64104 RepID=A0A1Y3M892_9BACI|nr:MULTISPECIES: SDR family NAD(P)-dependent oxidoreductase [Bacillus cereus group]EOQ10506.1 oxidoreductase [Bacillus cereus VDM021]OOG89864.1 Sorbitol-6-phosphate 2-dehydrogenase [Bacillus mycoides]MDF2083088.1 SDR family NAD(P)-dependent oxidoreductase [Bacillus pseudomycoides]OUM45924.1 oxidoreductase [Bacillus pseudomycoides]PEK67354.1 oxidoreductase [Bacillus pseudomycoides]
MKYTVITGASSGIGYETALAFAARGKNLIVAARRTEELEKLKSKVADINADLDVVIRNVDLSVTTNVYEFYESLQDYQIETWINNAGFGNFASVGEQNLNKIETMLHLNIESLTVLSSLYVRDYANVEGTQIINISSGGGYLIVADAVTYCATKFYVSAFTEGLAQELKEKGAVMQAKVLAPAATETEFAKRSLDADEFQYEDVIPKFHTAKEMAGFMLDLYDSENVVGIVNGETYEFQLREPIFPYVTRTRK